MPTVETILADIAAAQALWGKAVAGYDQIKADLSQNDVAVIETALNASGANLHAARLKIDADAA